MNAFVEQMCKLARETRRIPLQNILDDIAEWEWLLSLSIEDGQGTAEIQEEIDRLYSLIPSGDGIDEVDEPEHPDPFIRRMNRTYGKLHAKRKGACHRPDDYRSERQFKENARWTTTSR